jgi:hypothetical protein
MDAHLATDFAEFGRSGRVYDRREAIEMSPEGFTADLSPIEVSFLHADVALLTYRSALRTKGTVEFANRTSIWTKAGGRWLLRFHQGTPCDDWG